MGSEKIWFEDPQSLIKNLSLLPLSRYNLEEKLNAFTRLIIVISIILLIMKVKYWYVFLIAGLLLIITFYVALAKEPTIDYFNEDHEDFAFYSNTPIVSQNIEQKEIEENQKQETKFVEVQKQESEEVGISEFTYIRLPAEEIEEEIPKVEMSKEVDVTVETVKVESKPKSVKMTARNKSKRSFKIQPDKIAISHPAIRVKGLNKSSSTIVKKQVAAKSGPNEFTKIVRGLVDDDDVNADLIEQERQNFLNAVF